jgi:MFS family permease
MSKFVTIFVASLFLSASFGATLFLNSSLLGNFFAPNIVSLLFLSGALGSIILFLLVPQLIELFSKRLLLLFFLLLVVFATVGLAFAETAFQAGLSFLVYSSILFMIYYILDIFLEEGSEDNNTGEIRGIFLTLIHLGIALGPLFVAIVAVGDDLKPVYLFASLFLVPPILLAIFSFKSQIPQWHGLHEHHALLPLVTWWRAKNICRVTIAKLIFEIFFTVMIIYIPIYLHGSLGFEWSELGIIFTVMLLPFVLFGLPVGEIADHFLGEKEIMSAGFFITGGSLLIMPFLGASFLAWMIVLFLSRVGASLIEITTESYFFKHTNASETRLLSIFRLVRPTGIILGTIVVTLASNFFSFDKILFILAIIVFFGLKQSLSLKDTR